MAKSFATWVDTVTLDTMQAMVGKTEPSELEEVIRMALTIAYQQGMIDARFEEIDRNEARLRKARV